MSIEAQDARAARLSAGFAKQGRIPRSHRFRERSCRCHRRLRQTTSGCTRRRASSMAVFNGGVGGQPSACAALASGLGRNDAKCVIFFRAQPQSVRRHARTPHPFTAESVPSKLGTYQERMDGPVDPRHAWMRMRSRPGVTGPFPRTWRTLRRSACPSPSCPTGCRRPG